MSKNNIIRYYTNSKKTQISCDLLKSNEMQEGERIEHDIPRHVDVQFDDSRIDAIFMRTRTVCYRVELNQYLKLTER